MNLTFKHAFTLIELMTVLAIVIIISIVAIPAMNRYLIQSKVTEALSSAADLQTMITSEIAELESVTNSGASINEPTSLGRYVASFSVNNNGVISITTTTDAGAINFTLTPVYNSSSEQVSWTCAVSNSSSNSFVPSQCRI